MIKQQITYKNVSDLIPYARNSRTHSEAQVLQIAASIKEFGFTNPILIDGENGIIAGHGRVLAAMKLSINEVPCIELSGMTDTQKRAYIIADNKLALNAGWDNELLAVEFKELGEAGFDVGLTGFSLDEIADLSLEEIPAGLTDEDYVPDVQPDPVSKIGDVWLLGKHRVMCGDSTSIDAVETLMQSGKAEMIFTDPPYRMEAEGGSNQPIGRAAAKLGAAIAHLCDFDPVAFLNILPTCFNKGRMNAYIFCNKDLVPDYLSFAKDSGYAFNILFWKKPNAIPLGGQHRPDVEYLLTFRKSATFNNAIEGVSYSKCLEYARENSTPHPTMKPVAMIENQILISSSYSGVVLDLFGGSGSTLIACEKTGRESRLMELDPKYVDVIVKRWQEFTGLEAIHEQSGGTFNSMQ